MVPPIVCESLIISENYKVIFCLILFVPFADTIVLGIRLPVKQKLNVQPWLKQERYVL